MLTATVPAWSKGPRRKRGDRRSAVRFAPAQEIVCYCATEPEGVFRRARVCDISASGVCLVVRQPAEVGRLIEVELINGAHTFLCTRTLRVVRVFQGSDDRVLAGEFDRKLTYHELLPFIV